MKFEPPLDTIIVERNIINMMGGIALPLDKWRTEWWGRVVAAGPGMLRTLPEQLQNGTVHPMLPGELSPRDMDHYPMQYKVGDLVICPAGMQPIPEEMQHSNPNTRLFYASERQIVSRITLEDSDKPLTLNPPPEANRKDVK